MALVLPPDSAYDSFVSLVDATGYISSLTLYGATWTALSDSEKEVYLRIATRLIVDGIDEDVYTLDETDLPVCLAEATSLIAIHDVIHGLTTGSTTATIGAIKKEQVGSIVQEYYDTKANTDDYVSAIPAMAIPCLESVSYVFNSGLRGARQTTLGRS